MSVNMYFLHFLHYFYMKTLTLTVFPLLCFSSAKLGPPILLVSRLTFKFFSFIGLLSRNDLFLKYPSPFCLPTKAFFYMFSTGIFPSTISSPISSWLTDCLQEELTVVLWFCTKTVAVFRVRWWSICLNGQQALSDFHYC